MNDLDEEKLEAQESPEVSSGDDINIENIGKGSAIAGARGSIAAAFNISIGSFHLLPIMAALTVVSGVLTFLYLQLRPEPLCADQMAGEFNVAVSEFTVIDEEGNQIESEDGEKVAHHLRERISTNFEELNISDILVSEIWGPDCTGKISGETTDERSVAAELLAKKINAHVLIYGTITEKDGRNYFDPEFNLKHYNFSEADEVSGSHALGSRIRIALPFDDAVQALENPALSARINALNQITVGLVHYADDNLDKAMEFFTVAKENEYWSDYDGKEIVYLLLGNTSMRLYTRENSLSYLSDAANYYLTAYELNPYYGRAMIGYAGVLYLNAIGRPPELTIDQEKLLALEQFLNQVLQLEDQPDSANIETKVHYIFGQIYLARIYGGIQGEDWLSKAEKEYEYVIKDYEDGDLFIDGYAADAYSKLGVIAFNRGEYEKMESYFNTAIELASRYYEGEYFATLGELYYQQGEFDKAITSYEEAIISARSLGNEKQLERFTQAIEQISRDS